MVRELRSDHAGETGAVFIYQGITTVARWRQDTELLAFARQHGETETEHLRLIEDWLPAESRSRLLLPWRMAGWLTGTLPALFGRRAAPVQASWIGYPATTGLATMDWQLTDARADPPGASDAQERRGQCLPQHPWRHPPEEPQRRECCLGEGGRLGGDVRCGILGERVSSEGYAGGHGCVPPAACSPCCSDGVPASSMPAS